MNAGGRGTVLSLASPADPSRAAPQTCAGGARPRFRRPVYRIVVAQTLDLDWPWAHQLSPGCLDSLFLGVFVACLVRSREVLAAIAANRMALYVATGMSFAGVSVIFALRPGSLLLSSCLAATFALALFTVVTAAPARLATHRGPLCWLGIGAYSIYLFHMPLLYLANAIAADGLGSRLLATTLLVPVAAVSWRYIERPFIEYAQRWQYQFPPRSSELRAAEAAP